MTNRREIIEFTIKDMVGDFLYYNRKEDKELPIGSIEQAIIFDEVTIGDMTTMFKKELTKVLEVTTIL